MGEENTQTQGVALPEDLSDLADKGLTALTDKIQRRFQQVNGKERLSADDLAEMGVLADQLETVKAEFTRRDQANEQAEETRRSLAARMGEDEAAGTEPAEDAPTVTEATGDGDDAEVVADDDETQEEDTVEGVEDTAPVAIAASTGGKRKGGAVVTPRPTPSTKLADKPSDRFSIVASSDVPGVPTGKELDRGELSEALHKRARMLKDGSGQVLVASIQNLQPRNDIRNIKDDSGLIRAWDKATDLDNSRVASGGFCSPNDTIYDFACDFEEPPEVLDLPSLTASRGGLRYPESPLLGDVYADVTSGFTWTEANDIAAAEPGGPTKPCFVIPCPDFQEVRLQAQGLCVTAGNLMDRSWPELTNRYVDLVMAAHMHRMNALTIAKVVANSTTVAPTAVDLSASEAVLGLAELQIAALRDKFFMGADRLLDVALPRWVRSVIRRDLARRAGVIFTQITNSDITGHFSEIGARVQFVSDWQVMTTPATAWPTTVTMLVYPTGVHARLDGGTIDLGVIRDSTLNATNDYTAAWTEEFWAVVSRCPGTSYKVTVPLCPNGWTGAPNEIACPTA